MSRDHNGRRVEAMEQGFHGRKRNLKKVKDFLRL